MLVAVFYWLQYFEGGMGTRIDRMDFICLVNEDFVVLDKIIIEV